jgi:hypothetical protein
MREEGLVLAVEALRAMPSLSKPYDSGTHLLLKEEPLICVPIPAPSILRIQQVPDVQLRMHKAAEIGTVLLDRWVPLGTVAPLRNKEIAQAQAKQPEAVAN